ncbi:tat pathway signal sequence [Xylaria arbuscula]|nr:tat pathway signal sequence [Xylaria arbuscula]
MSPKEDYTPVSESDSYTEDDFQHNGCLSCQLLARKRREAKIWLSLGVSSLLISVFLLIAAWMHTPSQMQCSKVVSPWSSAWEAVEFFEDELTNYFNHSSLYRGPPTPERERAWDELWHYQGIPISNTGIKELNKSNKAEYIEAVGSDQNDPTYVGIVEVFHQLHCLNLIRQYTWFDHYKVGDELYPYDLMYPVGGRMHVDHCFEELRLSLMCYGDITPLPVAYDQHRAVGRTIDFSVHHKCRKFDKIVDWVKENGVETPQHNVPLSITREAAANPTPHPA